MTTLSPTRTDRMKLPRLYPPLWFVLFAATAIGLADLLPLRIELGLTTQVVAICIAIAGGLLALWARGLFHFAATTAHPFADANQLVIHGAYRISRNPMYLGMLLTLTGLVIWLQNLGGLALPPLFVLVINYCHILPEEQRLTAQFGESYLNYLSRTRRWL